MMVDYFGVLFEEMVKFFKNGIFFNIYVDGKCIGDVISFW